MGADMMILGERYPVCPACASSRVTGAFQLDEFTYGEGPAAFVLKVDVPVFCCDECSLQFTNHLAEGLRHEAVCRAFGLLTPSEIRALRGELDMTQEQLSRLTGIGKASLARWERGALLQNQANDNLLRLLRYAENVSRLKELPHHHVHPEDAAS